MLRFVRQFSLVTLLTILIAVSQAAKAGPIVNYKIVTGGSGHVPCKDNQGIDLPPEQYYDPIFDPNAPDPQADPYAYPTAAKRNSTITITASFRAGTGGFHGTVDVDACHYGLVPIPCTPASTPISVSENDTFTITWTVGVLPNYVSPAKSTSIILRLKETGQPDVLTSLGPSVYLVHKTPTAPQVKPWLGVLDNACTWAEGENTDDNVSKELTLGLFFAQRFAYPANTDSYWTVGGTTFRLSDFLATPGWVSGNCVDVSDYLLICANALGLNFKVARYEDSNHVMFNSQPVCLIGSSPTNFAYYSVSTWAWHQIAQPGGRVATTYVYDVCAAHWVDLAGNGYQNPPIKWPLVGFWQTAPNRGLVDIPDPSSPLLFFGPYVPSVL
jgi:hypothetical protein